MKQAKMILNSEAGRQAIEAVLGDVQKKAKTRCISLSDILDILERVERNLDIPKAKLDGVKVHYTGAEHFPNAYRGIPESTHFYAMHNGKRWEITKIERSTCPNNSRCVIITLTEQAKEAVLDSICIMAY